MSNRILYIALWPFWFAIVRDCPWIDAGLNRGHPFYFKWYGP